MNTETAAQVENATETALLEFWKEIGKAFPMVKGGEFPADLTAEMSATMEKMVTAWLSYNDPTFNDSDESATDSDYTWANLPTTCPDFVAHPHKVETQFTWTDKQGNKHQETRLSGCYQCREASASETQGTTALAVALLDLGVTCEVVQTGGFTMCVYIKTGEETYIYANGEGFAYYDGEQEGEYIDLETQFQNLNPNGKAQAIIADMKARNLQAINP